MKTRTVRIGGFLRRLREEHGNTAVEFGLMLPAILLILLASVELGRYGTEMNRVTNAARAGMQYAIQGQGYATATDFIIEAVRDDAGDTNNSLTVTTRAFCRCSSGRELTCTDECNQAGEDGEYAPMYVTIAVSETFQALFPLLAANPSFALPVNYSPSVVTTSRVR
jgi:Flp pilus assembly protein TadG